MCSYSNPAVRTGVRGCDPDMNDSLLINWQQNKCVCGIVTLHGRVNGVIC